MKTTLLPIALTAALFTVVSYGDSRAKSVHARLTGYQEVPTLSTNATGSFKGRINSQESEMSYELEYEDLRGAVTQAHIHLGATGTNGGIMIWLCGTATNPGPAGTPVCPASGKVSRTVTAADVIGPTGQGVSGGEFTAALRAIRAGVAYANVHTSMFTGGEIRGQVKDPDRD